MKKLLLIFLMLTVLGVRFIFVYHRDLGRTEVASSPKVSFTGYIDSDPDIRDTRQRIFVRVTQGADNIRGERVVLSVPKFPRYEYGTELSILGIIEIPKSFETERGEFNYRAYLAAKGVRYTARASDVQVVSEDKGNRILRALISFKKRFVHNLEIVLGEPHSSLAAGLIVGEQHALGEELLTNFRRVGLSHIIVLSGYNITIVVQTIGLLLMWLPRTLRIGTSAIAIVGFAALVGGGATVIRSTIMTLIALFGEFLGRDYSALRSLMVAGYLMVFHNPLIALYDPSFQLSFIATLGLITLSSPIEKRLQWFPEKFGGRTLLASTLATQIIVTPLILYLSGMISIGGILVNFLVLPAVPITMLAVFLTGFTGCFVVWISYAFGLVSHILLGYELFMVNWWSQFSWMTANISISAKTALLIYGAYAVIGGVWWRKSITERQRNSSQLQTS